MTDYGNLKVCIETLIRITEDNINRLEPDKQLTFGRGQAEAEIKAYKICLTLIEAANSNNEKEFESKEVSAGIDLDEVDYEQVIKYSPTEYRISKEDEILGRLNKVDLSIFNLNARLDTYKKDSNKLIDSLNDLNTRLMSLEYRKKTCEHPIIDDYGRCEVCSPKMVRVKTDKGFILDNDERNSNNEKEFESKEVPVAQLRTEQQPSKL